MTKQRYQDYYGDERISIWKHGKDVATLWRGRDGGHFVMWPRKGTIDYIGGWREAVAALRHHGYQKVSRKKR